MKRFSFCIFLFALLIGNVNSQENHETVMDLIKGYSGKMYQGSTKRVCLPKRECHGVNRMFRNLSRQRNWFVIDDIENISTNLNSGSAVCRKSANCGSDELELSTLWAILPAWKPYQSDSADFVYIIRNGEKAPPAQILFNMGRDMDETTALCQQRISFLENVSTESLVFEKMKCKRFTAHDDNGEKIGEGFELHFTATMKDLVKVKAKE